MRTGQSISFSALRKRHRQERFSAREHLACSICKRYSRKISYSPMFSVGEQWPPNQICSIRFFFFFFFPPVNCLETLCEEKHSVSVASSLFSCFFLSYCKLLHWVFVCCVKDTGVSVTFQPSAPLQHFSLFSFTEYFSRSYILVKASYKDEGQTTYIIFLPGFGNCQHQFPLI